MGYHALLVCSDEKLARIATPLFLELAFQVDSMSDASQAIEAMTSQHFDVIVVDGGSEGATSAVLNNIRKSSGHSNSVIIAFADGQTGVAAAYRAGANLVLTKPINIEQAKGTLRIARGLLRKSAENATQGIAASLPPPAPMVAGGNLPRESTFAAASASAPEFALPHTGSAYEDDATLTTGMVFPGSGGETAMPPLQFEAVAEEDAVPHGIDKQQLRKLPDEVDADPEDVAREAVVEAALPTPPIKLASDLNGASAHSATTTKVHDLAEIVMPPQLPTPPVRPVPVLGMSTSSHSGAAVAPAREKVSAASEKSAVEGKPEKPSGTSKATPIERKPAPEPPSIKLQKASKVSPASHFSAPDKRANGSRRIYVGSGILLAILVASYFVWARFLQVPAESASGTPHTALTEPSRANSASTSPVPERIRLADTNKAAARTNLPVQGMPDRPTTTRNEQAASIGGPEKIELVFEPKATRPAVSLIGVSPSGVTPSAITPIQVRPDTPKGEKPAPSEVAAVQPPSPLAMNSPAQSNLSGLISSGTNSSVPTLAQVKISQGLSQGLLIKSVMPKYPQGALTFHREGIVEIEATIDKEGHVIEPKVLSGSALFGAAALEAVRQWRYRPYYLNGQPVAISTQITIRFKGN